MPVAPEEKAIFDVMRDDPYRFLADIGDQEVLAWLRRLPIVTNDTDGPMEMVDLIYEVLLWPFVKQAWHLVDGNPGVSGRLHQISKVYDRAETELEYECGRTRRHPRKVNLIPFLDVYQNEGFP